MWGLQAADPGGLGYLPVLERLLASSPALRSGLAALLRAFSAGANAPAPPVAVPLNVPCALGTCTSVHARLCSFKLTRSASALYPGLLIHHSLSQRGADAAQGAGPAGIAERATPSTAHASSGSSVPSPLSNLPRRAPGSSSSDGMLASAFVGQDDDKDAHAAGGAPPARELPVPVPIQLSAPRPNMNFAQIVGRIALQVGAKLWACGAP